MSIMVMAPSRPQNMRPMSTSRPKVSSCPVIPSDKPVVENAETTSNSTGLRGNSWVSRSSQVALKITPRLMKSTVMARHTTAIKSQFNRDKASHLNQLNSICLNAKPSRIVKGEPKAYANFPIKTGKTVLVIDDVCTKGFSFEAARAYLTATGADVVCVAFLKALKNDYDALGSITLPNGPFRGNKIGSTRTAKIYGHSKHVVDSAAPSELTERLKRYQNWDWPDGLDDD